MSEQPSDEQLRDLRDCNPSNPFISPMAAELLTLRERNERLEKSLKIGWGDEREGIAKWMIANSLATGHGDTVDDLLNEAAGQIAELRKRVEGMREANEGMAIDRDEAIRQSQGYLKAARECLDERDAARVLLREWLHLGWSESLAARIATELGEG